MTDTTLALSEAFGAELDGAAAALDDIVAPLAAALALPAFTAEERAAAARQLRGILDRLAASLAGPANMPNIRGAFAAYRDAVRRASEAGATGAGIAALAHALQSRADALDALCGRVAQIHRLIGEQVAALEAVDE